MCDTILLETLLRGFRMSFVLFPILSSVCLVPPRVLNLFALLHSNARTFAGLLTPQLTALHHEAG